MSTRTTFSRKGRWPRPATRPTAVRRWRKRAAPPAIYRGASRELKGYDYDDHTDRALVTVSNVVGAATMTTGMTITNGMANGNYFYQRIGNKIQITSIALEAEFNQPQTDASSSTIRVLMIYDRQVNGAFPAIGDVLYDNANATNFNSAINIANRDRFAVLRDEQFTLDTASQLTRHYETYIKRPLDVCFKGSAGEHTIADFSSGAVYLIAFYVQQIGTTAPHINSVHVRVRYWDA